jgi:hypothetical protein
MISSVIFHEMAEVELNEAAQYYESEVRGLGKAFLSEVERAVLQIQFHVRILAVANQKRRPFYWRRRR